MSPRRIAASVAFAASLALMAMVSVADAERLGWFDAGFARTQSLDDHDMLGLGTGMRFESQYPVTLQAQLDGFFGRDMRYASVHAGPVLQSTQGKVRPWFEAYVGLSATNQPWGGLVRGFGTGATLGLSNDYGLFVQVTGTNSGRRWNSGEALFEVRVGVCQRTDVEPTRKSWKPPGM